MRHFVLERDVAAPKDLVFELLTDHTAWPAYAPVESVTLEHPGDHDARDHSR